MDKLFPGVNFSLMKEEELERVAFLSFCIYNVWYKEENNYGNYRKTKSSQSEN